VADYVVSTETRHVDRELVWRFLRDESYWAAGVPRDVMDRAIDGSICFSVFAGDPDRGGAQVGFARVVTDRATFAWLCDVFVLPEHRGKGAGKELMDAVMSHPAMPGLRNILLATKDAHALYARYGFAPLAEPARWMAIRRPYREG
jgi:GNAT superfamily N-acetyltransferase